MTRLSSTRSAIGPALHASSLPPTKRPVLPQAESTTSFLTKSRRVRVYAAQQSDNQAASPPTGTGGLDSCVAKETLLYDELLRHYRSRVDDIALLRQCLEKRHHRPEESHEDRQWVRTCQFREEWRVDRESLVLKSVADGICGDSSRMMHLRQHLKRSINVLLRAESLQTAATRQPKLLSKLPRLSIDLAIAQDLDRLVQRINEDEPRAVVLTIVERSRVHLQHLVQAIQAPVDTNFDFFVEPTDQSVVTEAAAFSPPSAAPQVLTLYENVVAAASVAPIHAKVASAPLSDAFRRNLEHQREVEARKAEKQLAVSHARVVAARRVQRAFRAMQRWRLERLVTAMHLRARVVHATRVLQRGLPERIQRYLSSKRKHRALLERHQGQRIAITCFWRWVYPRRCGFATYVHHSLVSELTTAAAVGIQCWYRQRKARRRLQDERRRQLAIDKRQAQRQWRLQQRFSQMITPINAELAQWSCHLAWERSRAMTEHARDSARLAHKWERYEQQLHVNVLKARLPAAWIPQQDAVSGERYFLNIHTGAESREHPHEALYRVLVKKQRVRAADQQARQQARMEHYISRLHDMVTTKNEHGLDYLMSCLEKVGSRSVVSVTSF